MAQDNIPRSNVQPHDAEQFRLLVQGTVDYAIFMLDPAGYIVTWNAGAERMKGYRAEEIIGHHFSRFYPEEANARGWPQYELKIAAEEGRFEDEGWRVRKDGTQFWANVVITALRNEAGELRGFSKVTRDMTERKRAEETAHRLVEEATARRVAEENARLIQEQREQLRVTLNSIGDGVISIDAEGRVRLLNPVAQALTGWTSAEATGRPLAEIFPLLNEKTREPVENPALMALKEGTNVGLANHTILVAKDGKERPIDDIAAPIRSEDGKLLGAVLVFRDVTERREAEEQLRNSEQRFARFMQHLPGLAWIKDALGRYVFANDAALKAFRTSRENLYGKTDDEIFPPETAAIFRQNDRRALESIAGVQVVEALLHEDDQVRYSLVSKFPIFAPEGQAILVGGMAIDVTEQRRVEEKLRETDRRKDEFLATLAHELRNPLAPIRTSLQVLTLPRIDPHVAQETRAVLERQVENLVRLVDDLLDVSRVMGGKIELRKETVEVSTIVARAVETAKPLLDAQRHHFDIKIAPESLLLEADPVRIAQVLGNLLTNSAKYTEPDGHISLSARREGSDAVISVLDNGIGIAPDVLPHVFELFVQADHAFTKAHGGLGIGLTLVKNLVEMHGGRVEARSAGLGQGAEFIVRLPLAQKPKQESVPEPAESTRADRTPTGHRLLVVDDNEDAANMMATLQRLRGHDVQVAHNGAKALELALSHRPEVIFLDIGLPDIDGYEVARRLRKIPLVAQTVLVALTGWGQESDRRRTAEAGFDHHLVKPAEPKEIENLLAALPSPKAGSR